MVRSLTIVLKGFCILLPLLARAEFQFLSRHHIQIPDFLKSLGLIKVLITRLAFLAAKASPFRKSDRTQSLLIATLFLPGHWLVDLSLLAVDLAFDDRLLKASRPIHDRSRALD